MKKRFSQKKKFFYFFESMHVKEKKCFSSNPILTH
jgi:hypothetical protein